MKGIRIICFSPTGSTRKLAQTVAESLELPVALTDCTMPEARAALNASGADIDPDETLLFACPVYYGRAQADAAACFRTLRGRGQPVILLVNYGNRHYDDALRELYDIALAGGFTPVAAAAFVSEHSFSTADYPMAAGRPDAADLDMARRFGAAVRKALQSGPVPMPAPPGNAEYKPYPEFHRAPVSVDGCTLCGVCASVCPVEAITLTDNAVVTLESACIVCQACVKQCPEGVRLDAAPGSVETREHLKKLGLLDTRREPEVFGV